MYTPNHFKQSNIDEVKEFIFANSFGILINQVNGRPWATHIPLELGINKDGKDTLSGHISRGNIQGKAFQENNDVLAIFHGPHTYISSSWYNHENVPTWNYVAVHVYGKVRIIEGEELYQSLKKLVDKYEQQSEKAVTMEGFSAGYLERELKGIIGFEIVIEDIQSAYKLSQNRDEVNKARIIEQLEKRGDAHSTEIADLMKSYKR